MKIKKMDDKPMVIHTKEKAKIHAHEPKGAKIKGSNIYTNFTEEKARAHLKEMLPKLDYWKRYEELSDNGQFEEFKQRLIREINDLSIEGLPKVERLNALAGSYVNSGIRIRWRAVFRLYSVLTEPDLPHNHDGIPGRPCHDGSMDLYCADDLSTVKKIPEIGKIRKTACKIKSAVLL